MASPFNVFRKHQKVLIAVGGAGLLIVWLLGDVLSNFAAQSFSSAGRADREYDPNEVVVTYDGGKITREELDDLVQRRRLLTHFLREAARLGASRVGEGAQLAVYPVVPFNQSEEDPNVEENAVSSKILVEAAEREGMAIGNDAVNRYLEQVCLKSVTGDELRQILKRYSNQNRPVSMPMIFDELRKAMLAYDYQRSQIFALTSVLPEQRFEDWLKVHDKIEIESVAVRAEPFMVNVGDPSDAELQALFDQYKDREPSIDVAMRTELPSATPGFKIPRKVAIEYLIVDYGTVLAELSEKVTDEEIAAYYESNKDPEFIRPDIDVQPLEDSSSLPADAPSSDAPATDDSEKEPSTTPPVDEENDAESEAAEADLNAADDANASEDPAVKDESTDEVSPEPAPEEETNSESATDTETEESSPAEDATNENAAASRKLKVQFAAYQDENDQPEAAEEANATENEAAKDDSAETPAANSVSDQTPSKETDESDSSAIDGSNTSDAAAKEEDTTDVEPEPKKKEFLPLNEVREEIRLRIASERVPERQGEIVSNILARLKTEFNKYDVQTLDLAEDRAHEVPPPKYDLEQIAIDEGLRFEKTGDVSALELSKIDEIGESVNLQTRTSLVQLLFANEQLFRPITSVARLDGFDSATGGMRFNEFIVVKVRDEPGRVPKLDEVKTDVIRAWKMQKASELALAEAKKIASKARESNKPLAEVIGDDEAYEVNESAPFSFIELGLDGQSMHLAQPYGMVAIGPDFLRSVFKMEPDSVEAIFNHDRSIAYVVRMVRRLKSPDQLHDEFLVDVDRWPGGFAFNNGRRAEMGAQFAQGFSEAHGIDWKIDPSALREPR